MEPYYLINNVFLTQLYNRILLSLDEAIETWGKDFRRQLFLYEVLLFDIQPHISQDTINSLVETCLQASMEKEEGIFHNFSISFEPCEKQDLLEQQYIFQNEIEFNATTLKKLTASLNPNKFQIGVWFNKENKLAIWGVKPKIISFLTINSFSPGKISVSCTSDKNNSFKCHISLSGTGFINTFTEKMNPISDWFSNNKPFTSLQKVWDFNRLIAQMFHSGYGGIVLLVREDVDNWKNSISQPVVYKSNQKFGFKNKNLINKYDFFTQLEIDAKQNKETSDLEKEFFRLKIELISEKAKSAVEDIGNLTKVDGATILSENFNVLAFGAKIEAKEKTPEKVLVVEPLDKKTEEKSLATIGGMRHQSAAKFVSSQKDCLAIVVSEDKKVSVFSWNFDRQLVQQIKNFEFVILD